MVSRDIKEVGVKVRNTPRKEGATPHAKPEKKREKEAPSLTIKSALQDLIKRKTESLKLAQGFVNRTIREFETVKTLTVLNQRRVHQLTEYFDVWRTLESVLEEYLNELEKLLELLK